MARARLACRVHRSKARVSTVARVAGPGTRGVPVAGCISPRPHPGRRRPPHSGMLMGCASITHAMRAAPCGSPWEAGSRWPRYCPRCARPGPGLPGCSRAQWRVAAPGGRPRRCVSRGSGRSVGSCSTLRGPGCCSPRAGSSRQHSITRYVSAPGAGGCSLQRAIGGCGAGCRQQRRIGPGTAGWPGRSPHGGRELLASARLKSQITFSVACRRVPAELCSGFRVYSAGDDQVLPVMWLAEMRPGGRG